MGRLLAIDILKENEKYTIREMWTDGVSGHKYEERKVKYSAAEAERYGLRTAIYLKVKFLGITEATA